jgi:hypothetical protein
VEASPFQRHLWFYWDLEKWSEISDHFPSTLFSSAAARHLPRCQRVPSWCPRAACHRLSRWVRFHHLTSKKKRRAPPLSGAGALQALDPPAPCPAPSVAPRPCTEAGRGSPGGVCVCRAMWHCWQRTKRGAMPHLPRLRARGGGVPLSLHMRVLEAARSRPTPRFAVFAVLLRVRTTRETEDRRNAPGLVHETAPRVRGQAF